MPARFRPAAKPSGWDALTAIAADFGFARWEDLTPCGAGALFPFGLGALPSGRLGMLLAAVYAVASLAQAVGGRLCLKLAAVCAFMHCCWRR